MSFHLDNVKSEVKTESTADEEELCRFCAQGGSQYSSIFKENLNESLSSFLGISVQESDNWPKFICQKCWEAAKVSVDFMSSVRRAETTFRTLFGELAEAIVTKPDIELIDVKEISLEPESKASQDDTSDEYIPDPSSSDELGVSKFTRRRGRPRKKFLTEYTLTTRSGRKNTESLPQEIDSTETPIRINRNYAEKLHEDDERIKNFFTLRCNFCSEGFDKFKVLKSHCQKAHKKEAFIICCDKKLNNRTKIVAHLNYHTNPNAYKCTKCSKTYHTAHGLQHHELNRHATKDDLKYKCPDCPRSFATLYRLRTHRQSHMPQAEKKFKCPQCDKAFALNSILTQHIRHSHEGRNKHICEICAKEIKSKYTYQLHMENHYFSGVGKHACTICGKLFKRPRLLQLHMERHNQTGEVFKCDICGKESPNKSALTRHIQYSHKTARKHSCNLCSSAFKTPVALKEHMATHTSSQILYTCLFCPKQFNSNANKYVHQKRKHPVEYEAMKQNKLPPGKT
ncbi:transcription factor grauzone-like [Phlebotomus argentipes]|uniref:transcription factor grauzone-like n=1 Tax=Phlebotomus argentipes TaxID=94469 RepID=UPI00289343C7|nr:transcription factor grauzone-like [Phlebotomus argentipes]